MVPHLVTFVADSHSSCTNLLDLVRMVDYLQG
ncbi:MAG: hypothetical protein Nkreftii_003638 [Candidatus Nitrospira kreftii]|uniref:Uncharacterized protein n=1 Tax=Candidatus Nitrospira kreftii TaxID=2652173 RepID=A0A7S8J1J0_9BACT|nr:MAG: hypothetical protein Nkreftii_003638 [Candidatus Nitrospira kreftii]